MENLDEQPIGGSGAYELPAEEAPPEEESQAPVGPLEKRLDSKVWKVRTQALEELGELLRAQQGPFEEYQGCLVKYVADSHPSAQEKGIDILSIYIETRPELLLVLTESLVATLIEKGFTSNKSNVKAKAADSLLELFSIQTGELAPFFEGVSRPLNNKNLKTQAAAISAVNSLMSNFGMQRVPFKPFIAVIEKCASVSNPAVRSEALNFYKECFKWGREAFLPLVDKLKKAQQDELKKAFDESSEPPVPLKRLRHEEFKEHATELNEAPKKLDLYDQVDARDLSVKFNEKWCDRLLALEKWTERKEALEELNRQADYPKLVDSNILPLAQLAKRLINDSNMQVMLSTIKLVGLLAKGYCRSFEQFAKHFLPILIQKFKDKKTAMLTETHTALDNLLFSVSLEYSVDEIKLGLEDKTPTVKTNVCVWLQRVLVSAGQEDLERTASKFLSILKKNTDDSVVEVRNSTFKLIGILLDRCPHIVRPAIRDLPKAKLSKIAGYNAGEEETKAPAQKTGGAKPQKKTPLKLASPPTLSEDSGDLVASVVPAEILEKVQQSAWKEKVAGLQLFSE